MNGEKPTSEVGKEAGELELGEKWKEYKASIEAKRERGKALIKELSQKEELTKEDVERLLESSIGTSAFSLVGTEGGMELLKKLDQFVGKDPERYKEMQEAALDKKIVDEMMKKE